MKRAIHASKTAMPDRDVLLLVLFISLLLISFTAGCGGARIAPPTMPPDMEPIRQSLITEVSVDSGNAYEWHKVALGELVYIDRHYTFSTLPAKYLGLFYLQTANDDKNMVGDHFITFQVNEDVTVYVVYPKVSMEDRPSWLAEWTDTGDEIVTTDRDFGVLAKDFPAGTVSLAGNEGGSSMYTVLVRPQDSSSGIHQPQVDVFGIPMLYPTKPGTLAWNSLHWDNGNRRTFDSSRYDPDDPSGLSVERGASHSYIDGHGMLVMSGSSPRFYLQGQEGDSMLISNKFWKNVEITVYYKRISDEGERYAGLSIGARTGPHVGCDATTYYAIMRNDGNLNFVKELEHPISSGLDGKPIWDGDPTPHDYWIGMKFVIYNIDNDQHVKLEAYLDRTGGVDGGVWEKVNEHTDDGGWVVPHNCEGRAPDYIITEGGGRVFIRNDAVDEALYKWLSIREISVE